MAESILNGKLILAVDDEPDMLAVLETIKRPARMAGLTRPLPMKMRSGR
jgi:hypothetical protein